MTTPPPATPDYLEEDELSDETRHLLSSLQRERGWVLNHFYLYDGFWVTPRQVQSIVACQNHFQARDSDIILASNPKSGTTWLKALTFALLNRSTTTDPLLKSNPHDLVPFLELTLYFRGLPDLSSLPSPRLFGTHIPFHALPPSVKHTTSSKIVYICRNPKDMFVSNWHFTNKLRPKEKGPNDVGEAFDMYCNGVSLYGPYWDHVLGYWEESLRNPRKVLFLKYEEVRERPAEQLMRLAEFLGCPFSAAEEGEGKVEEVLRLCSLENLSRLEVNKEGRLVTGEPSQAYFRKGEVGGWSEILTPEMAQRLDRITQEKMLDRGFKF